MLFTMGWLTKIFKGSSHKISGGQYAGRYEDDTILEVPATSEVFVTLSSMSITGLIPFQHLKLKIFIMNLIYRRQGQILTEKK